MINQKIVCILLLLFILNSCVSKPEGIVYHGKQVSEGIEVDGCLDEAVWQQIPQMVMKDNLTGEEVKDTSIQTYVWSCYDHENLYIAFECRDKDIWGTFTKRDEYLWKEEVVEVFIDTDDDPDTYVEIELSPSNVLFDSYIVNPQKIDFIETAKFDLPGIKTAVKVVGTLNKRDDLDHSWTVEMAIPFADLTGDKSLDVSKLGKWRINFYRVNRDLGKDDGKYAWSPTLGGFHTPSQFGFFNFN